MTQCTNAYLSRLLEIERAARCLLSVIDKAPYRLTAKTFGQDAVEASAVLKELRAALNGEHDADSI